jgi:hypothetical protein
MIRHARLLGSRAWGIGERGTKTHAVEALHSQRPSHAAPSRMPWTQVVPSVHKEEEAQHSVKLGSVYPTPR